MAQGGALSGIRNTVFTRWLPPGAAFAGLSGRIALAGNAPGFDEALVVLGTSADGQAACLRRNRETLPAVPALARLWAGILKSNAARQVSQTVSLTLPVPMALPQAGTCLVTLVSAGYPFLRRDAALYATASASLAVGIVQGGRSAEAFGIGGEFRYPLGGAALATYVGLRARRRLAVDGLAVSLSASAVAGAPAGSAWLPAPAGAWRVTTRVLHLGAAACSAAGLLGHGAGDDHDVLRSPGPAPVSLSGADMLPPMTLSGQGFDAAQSTGFVPLGTVLAAGECLVAVQTVPAWGRAGQAGCGEPVYPVFACGAVGRTEAVLFREKGPKSFYYRRLHVDRGSDCEFLDWRNGYALECSRRSKSFLVLFLEKGLLPSCHIWPRNPYAIAPAP